MELKKVIEGIIKLVIDSLLFFDDYIEGAGYCSSRADNLTLDAPSVTPTTFFSLDKSYNVINQSQGITGTHAYAQATAITLFFVNYRCLSQCHSLHSLYFYSKLVFYYLYVTLVSKRCPHHFSESLFIGNHNAVAIQPDYSFIFKSFE